MLIRNVDDGNNFGIWNRHRVVTSHKTASALTITTTVAATSPTYNQTDATSPHTAETQTPKTRQQSKRKHNQVNLAKPGWTVEAEPLSPSRGKSSRVRPWLISQGEVWQSHSTQKSQDNRQPTTPASQSSPAPERPHLHLRHQTHKAPQAIDGKVPSVVRRVSHGSTALGGDRTPRGGHHRATHTNA